MSEDRVILVVGPTAVGKTGASVLLAQQLKTEIISSDSMQIYRHMDIGTGKPSPHELKAATHHMIDIASPWEEYSAGRFLDAVTPMITRLHDEGRMPLVVGGTGLYVKAMTRGLFEGPGADWELRGQLLEESPEELYRRLKELDPEAAIEIGSANTRRIVRALEVCIKSGQPVTKLRAEGTEPLPVRFVKLALMREREELYAMIEARVDMMLKAGLADEVRALMDMRPARTAMQAIGYKEMAAHLRGEYPLEEAVRLIKRNTRRYAKRQMTWFRSESGLTWVDITGLHSPHDVHARLKGALKKLI